MKLGNYIILIFLIYCFDHSVHGQIDTLLPNDSLKVYSDTLTKQNAKDTIPKVVKPSSSNLPARDDEVKFADDAIDSEIMYGARDTQWYDHKFRTMHLYGEAYVEYEGKKLEAGYISFDMEDNLATAYSIKDDRGHIIEQPIFSDGNKQYTYDKLTYNFKTEKGIVYDAISTEGDLYIHGHKTKFVAGGVDSLQNNDIVYNENALITSCNHPEPHFGIRSRKMKVITDKVAIIGPSNLEIAGVPTPLWIPFGFFPLTDGESTGLLFQDFDYNLTQGFGVRGIGWYFPISDYINLAARANFYTNGSHGINLNSTYKKRYKYDGSITLGYNSNRFESAEDAFIENNISYSVVWNHSQAAKAHPYRRISGSIDFQGQGFDQQTQTTASSQLRQVYRSNFSFSHTMPETPFTFSAAFNHSQNIRTGDSDISFPNIQLRMNTINPFKRKNKSSTKEAWYEKITFRYNNEVKGFLDAQDSLSLFSKEALEDLRFGVSHSATSDVSLRFLKYFNFRPNINYDEDWVFKTANRSLITTMEQEERDTVIIRDGVSIDSTFFADTTIFDVETNYINEFKAYRNYSVGVQLNTQLFASLPATKGWFRGWRQTLKPNVSLNYSPSTIDKYQLELETGVDEFDLVTWSPFERSAISIPSLSNESFAINYGINGPMEMKYYSKKDSIEKKIKIFDDISLSGNYNFALDSLNFRKLTGRATSRLFNGLTTLTFNYGLDTYQENETGQRINRFVTEKQWFPLRLDDGFIKVSTGLRISDVINIFSKKKTSDERPNSNSFDSDGLDQDRNSIVNEEKELGSILDWIKNIRVDHTIQYNYTTTGEESNFEALTHSLRFSGQVPLTPKWTMSIGNFSYDFKNRSFVYPALTFSRDLHCWQMNFSWTPSNTNPALSSYSFFIGVSSSSLNFLKYTYGRNIVDGLVNGAGIF